MEAAGPQSDAAVVEDAGCCDGGGELSAPAFDADLSHTFDAIEIGPGEENAALCQSWTLGNDTSLWVNAVRSINDGGWHHSNWIFVPDTMFGDDGTWPCAERGFDQIIAAASGGVFFAQSTQAEGEEQRFPEGVAFELPPGTRIVGQLHLLNFDAAPLRTEFRFEVDTIDAAEVKVPLRPMAFTNLALDIAPAVKTVASMQCGLPQPDLDIYYVLPHYHELGLTLRLEVVGGSSDGEEIFRADAAFGDPLGKSFDPPIAVRGAQALRISCEYENPRDVSVAYGIGDQEMCVVLVYSDAQGLGGGLALTAAAGQMVGDAYVSEAACLGGMLLP